jgi:hypothetical protein
LLFDSISSPKRGFMRQRPEWAHVMLAFASFPLSDDYVRIGA